MAFQRLYRRTATSWRFQWAEKNVDISETAIVGGAMTPEDATTLANTWLAQHQVPGEKLILRIISISPFNLALYRKTLTGNPAIDDVVPADWWV